MKWPPEGNDMSARPGTSWNGNATRASLIVLNFNGLDVLKPCVTSLLSAMGRNDELIVVDNGSTDGSPEWLTARDDLTPVLLPENTYIFGLNKGLEVATGKYIAFLNNDMTVDPGFVEQSLVNFASDDIFAVCPRILDADGSEQGSRTSGYWSKGLIFYQSLRHSDQVTDCFFAVGGQSFFNHAKLLEIGSIDPLLWPMYHEDIELSYRAWKRGWRIVYAPRAVAFHLGSRTSKKVFTPTQLRSFVRQNEYLIVWKNVTDPRLVMEHIVMLPLRLLTAAAKRDWPTIFGFAQAARRISHVHARRRIAKAHFKVTDRDVLQHVSSIR